MTKQFDRAMQPGRAKWKFQTQRTWSPLMISNLTQPRAKVHEQSEASDDPLRALVDACVSNVAVLDESGSILYASKAWWLFPDSTLPQGESLTIAPGYFRTCRRHTESEFDEEAAITLEDDVRQIIFNEAREFHRTYYSPTVNKGRPFVMHAARLNLPGPTFRVLMTHEDVPAAREDLNYVRERWTQLLETTRVMAWEGEVEGLRFTCVSEQAVKMLGYSTNAWYQPSFLARHIHPDDRRRVLNTYLKKTRVAEHFDVTFRMLRSDGEVAWVQNLVTVIPENGGSGRMHGFIIDITERKRGEEALKYLGSRLIAAQEEERKRIARELHDDLNQRMAVLTIELEQLGQKIKKPLSVRKGIEKLRHQAQEISSDIHRLSYRLHPSKLDHLGLAAAIKSLCDELSIVQKGRVNVHFHQSGPASDVPKDATLCLFRIAQEALRNCVKHSGADLVHVVLTKTDRAVRLCVSDNGCGFSPAPGMDKGLGFISMQERLRLLDGEIKIFSKPQRGTHIDVSIPLNSRT